MRPRSPHPLERPLSRRELMAAIVALGLVGVTGGRRAALVHESTDDETPPYTSLSQFPTA